MTVATVSGRGGTRDRVVAQLRSQIVDGTLAPGTPLRVEPLMRVLGVSNSPLREAFVQLQSEGLVTVSANRGATVTGLTSPDAADLVHLSALLWDAVVRWTVPVLDAGPVDAIRRAQVDLGLALRGGDLPNGVLCAERIDEELLGACWSTELVRSLSAARPRQRRLMRACVTPEILRAQHRLVERIRDAAGSSDVTDAAAAMREVWQLVEAESRRRLPAGEPA
jgi:DNA-binding GntR family transcriptional regulator